MKISTGLAGEMSGSMGGITASHNRGGAYLRRRSIPVNPNTARQQLVRAAFGGLVQAWTNTLTDAQRQAWRDYAASVPRTDSLGNTINLTGQQWYIAANTPRDQGLMALGHPAAGIVNDAPTLFNTGEPVLDVTEFSVSGDSVTFEITYTAALSDAAATLVYIGSPQNAGVTFFKGPYQLAAADSAAAAATTISIVADVTDPLQWASDIVITAANVGSFYPLRIINTFDDGRLSQAWQAMLQLIAGV